jgi:hypothetical protein
MLPLVLSSFFASVLHILRGDSVSDSTASCRDIDTHLLRTRFYTFRVLLERLILFLKYTNTWYSTFTPYVPFCVYL